MLYYIYCFIKGKQSDSIALDSYGIDGQTVAYIYDYKGFSVVYGLVSQEHFGRENLDRHIRNRYWLDKNARAHDSAISTIMRYGAVLPMSFCTIFENKENIKTFCDTYSQVLHDHLQLAERTEQYELRIRVQHEIFRQAFLEKKEWMNAYAEVKRKPRGTAYMYKKRLDDTLHRKMEQIMNEDTQEIIKTLDKRCESVQQKSVPAADDQTHTVLIRAALLLHKQHKSVLNETIEQLQRQYESQGYEITVKGPYPIYDFVKMEELTHDKSLSSSTKQTDDVV